MVYCSRCEYQCPTKEDAGKCPFQGDTPMTDKTREEIAKQLMTEYGDAFDYPVVDRILAIPEIKEGQELLEKAKSGVLVELLDGGRTDVAVGDFRRIKPLASGESR